MIKKKFRDLENKIMRLEKDFLNEEKLDKIPTRDGYGKALVQLGEKNPNVVVLGADLSESTRTHWFRDKFPERFIEVGIAEQNMMSIAAGLALEGKIPFVSTYAVFCPGRNWDQLRVSVAYPKANVKLTGAHSGISVGPDGATHQALEDIAITRVIPNLVVLVPCDAEETRKATLAAASFKGPVYLRFARNATAVFTTARTPFKIGRAEIFKEGADYAFIAAGPVLYNALRAAYELEKEKGWHIRVINLHTVKPIDKEMILKTAQEVKKIITVEEHQIDGGLGSAVCEIVSESRPLPVKRLGIPNRFGESGQPEELIRKFGLDKEGIKKEALNFFSG